MCVWSLILLFVVFDKECVKMLKKYDIFIYYILFYIINICDFGCCFWNEKFLFFLKKDMLSILNWNNNSFFKIKY